MDPSTGASFSAVRREEDFEETTLWGKDETENALSGIGDLERKEEMSAALPLATAMLAAAFSIGFLPAQRTPEHAYSSGTSEQ